MSTHFVSFYSLTCFVSSKKDSSYDSLLIKSPLYFLHVTEDYIVKVYYNRRIHKSYILNFFKRTEIKSVNLLCTENNSLF